MLRLNDEEIELEAKIDTGAEYCVFERSYAESVGLQVEEGKRVVFSTATGRFVAFGHWITIDACGFDVETFAYFLSGHPKTGHTRSLQNQPSEN